MKVWVLIKEDYCTREIIDIFISIKDAITLKSEYEEVESILVINYEIEEWEIKE